MHAPTTVPGGRRHQIDSFRADHVAGLVRESLSLGIVQRTRQCRAAGKIGNSGGVAEGTRSPCALHTICDRSAQAEGYVCRKHTTGGSRMRLARFGCRWGRRASLSSPERTEPSLTPAVSRRAGTADLRTQRPYGQGRCAMANAATEGIPHDDVSGGGARNGGNC